MWRVQFIDVRDLAEWTLDMVEAKRIGVHNADGPAQPLPMEQLLDTCKIVSGSSARFTWASEEFLAEQHVEAWSQMPLWVPESDPSNAGFFAFDSRKAVAARLVFRPVQETVRATLEWDATRPADHVWRAGLTREREAELLEAYRGDQGG